MHYYLKIYTVIGKYTTQKTDPNSGEKRKEHLVGFSETEELMHRDARVFIPAQVNSK